MADVEKTGSVFTRLPGDTSIWVVLISVFGVLASVWLVVRVGDDPGERVRLPEEARLANFTLLPPQGPWMGINVATNEEALRHNVRLKSGIVVSRVMLGSPAYNAGIQVGDVVERVDRTNIRMPLDLMNALSKHKVGDTVRVTINRNARSQKFFVKLSSQPMGTLAAATGAVNAVWLGADVQAVDKLLAKQLGLPDTRGVVVSYVYPSSPAFSAGLAQGDVIRRVGEIRLRDIDQLKTLTARHRPGDVLRMVVWHKGAQKDLKVALATVPPPEKQPHPTLPEAEVEIEAAWLGLDIVPISRAEARELGLPGDLRGMVVDGVVAGTGVDAGFLMGDVIVAVNGRQTPNVKAFQEATEGAVGAVVDAIRFGRHIYISVPPPGGTQDIGNQQPPVRQVAFRTW